MSLAARQRILISGPSGFIGRHLCARLSGDHAVYGVTRGAGTLPAGCVAVTADLATSFSTEAWPDRVDAVVHLAQSARHREFPDGAADMTAVNVSATARLIEYARRAGAATFVLASTGNVYTPGPAPVAEDSAIAPRHFYAASKAAAECLVRPYADLMRVCVLRLFYPYGPGQENRLIPSLVERIREGRAVSLGGARDGLVLTPTYVEDIADVIVAAIGDSRVDGTLNVSAPGIMTLRQVGEAIGRAIDAPVRFENTGGPEPACIIPDLTRLNDLYPLSRFSTLETGLARMLRERPLVT